MIDSSKLKVIKFIGYILLIILAVFIGVGIGQTVADHNQKKESAESKQTATKEGLNQEEVKEFLVNYYTKKDLGENRNRYKEYMTDGLYKQTVAKEEEPVSQTYKGFVVDFQFKSAEIYINQDKLQVIAQVNYVNTLLDEKKNYNTAQKNVLNKKTLRMSYTNENGKMKVNKMESIILTDQTGDYGILDSTKPSEGSTTDSSTKPTTTPSTSNSN
ncbi:hypothetical protein GMD4S_00240 [Streptococcus sp. GMD4S]|jgi:putative uncharacterized protein gbs1132|uniref:hypothetical protein n=1 Tax=Streptococcus TaxID=1301 RepID=UPI000280DA6D|nr:MULTISPECIES: hypothetical protein [Streptococcus]EKA07096.1 hypothetical protein GMD6S_01822 [Streptococcus sp. GMD6S]EKA12230.1 hypothetical protein GMD4S_00240 [Streptococcus sp. GMD4S]MBS9397522.1 hypothetical protein [Streptococcus oralis]